MHWREFKFIGDGKGIHEASLTQESEEQIADKALALLQQKIEEAKKEGRLLGIKQASAFIERIYDQPTIADEMEKWVIPYGYKFLSAASPQG